MSLADSLRDRRALIMRLIMAEAMARRGEGPLALRPMRSEGVRRLNLEESQPDGEGEGELKP